MKIILAPDKFKGCMKSPQICEIIKGAFLEVIPDARIVCLPMADGGEGTVEALISAVDGELRHASVSNPVGKKIDATFGLYNNGRSAIIEMSEASGLQLLSRSEMAPSKTSTYGTGELILAALDSGASEITVGIGGSATIDGGAGMAQALGFQLLDKDGHPIHPGGAGLEKIEHISCENADRRLYKVKVKVACDVTNPLLGRDGAARVYGPQKGATPEMIRHIESGLSRFASLLQKCGLLDSPDKPGDGAAGGLGMGLRTFCRAEMLSGAKLVMEASGLREHLKGASLLVTGEGCTDCQTRSGKLCSELAKAAKSAGVPAMLLSGSLKGDIQRLNDSFDVALSISTGHGSIDEAIAAGRHDLYFTARNLARLIKLRLA